MRMCKCDRCGTVGTPSGFIAMEGHPVTDQDGRFVSYDICPGCRRLFEAWVKADPAGDIPPGRLMDIAHELRLDLDLETSGRYNHDRTWIAGYACAMSEAMSVIGKHAHGADGSEGEEE